MGIERTAVGSAATDLYLDLLKKCLTRYATRGDAIAPDGTRYPFDADLRSDGRDLPVEAETMIGLRRLDNLQACIADILEDDVRGDLIETGVWRGGAVIFMRAVLRAYGADDRIVWAADSFQGLPPPDHETFPRETDDASELWQREDLAISLEEVKENFARYGVLDEQVRFLSGWFRDTLPDAPIEHLSLLRLDGDMYESTMVALAALYPKLEPGGFVIVDDYGCYESCRAAVEEFRAEHDIADEIHPIDWSGVYWRRSA